MTGRAQRFADALSAFESSGEPDDLLAQFGEGAELSRPEADLTGPQTDAAAFWQAYADQFQEISTTFAAVDEAGDLGVLEWSSTGKLSTGRAIDYKGVSLLHFGDDDTVQRFATYYDTAAFLEPTA